jgi:hypothetical protein
MPFAPYLALIAALAAAPASPSVSTTAPKPSGPPEIVDFGQAPADTIDSFRVEVRNPACAEPQSFRFVIQNLPWIRLTNGDRLASVQRGEARTFEAQINLSGLKPGRYSGNLYVVCETCAQFALSLCDIDKRRFLLQVEVVPAA